MYRYLDRAITELSDGEQMVLRALRDWSVAVHRQRCPVDAVTLRFLSHRFIGGLEPFNEVLFLLSRHGRHRLELGCPCHPMITEGEAMLMALFFPERTDLRPQVAALAHPGHVARICERIGELRAAMLVSGIA